MTTTEINNKKVKDLTIKEFKHLIQDSIAEDIEAWRDTLDILSNKQLMAQVRKSDNAMQQGKLSEFVLWEKVKRNV